ncbi:hypothetical protein GGD83_001575 [Rhodoblastus sphagnicola]|uniref:DUF721 domain-containing protein n=1 Tax=Rhodoblastus sphagnicola TaxID=333368 RepID=UPI001802390B|nr:DciA family protein [Rhodoblastus sphagnicola]MBB4197783.1 hypothetical protein [Rhodoblastus sphagnicola]
MNPRKKASYPKPLADLIGGAVDPVLAKQGFGQSSLILHWDDIIGQRLAECCEPIKLQWPPRPRERDPNAAVEPATLVLRVIGAMAIEVQHMAPQIVQRVNAHLGWRAVGRLAIRQGPLERAAGPIRIAPPDPEALEEARRATEGVLDEGLRKALTLLGARAIRGRAGGV